MSLLVSLLGLFAAIPVVVLLIRANELFLLRLRGGKLRVARGRIPQQLLNDVADVLRGLDEASVRGVVEDRRVRVYVEGELSEAQRQRLRNTVSLWPVAKIRAAPRRR